MEGKKKETDRSSQVYKDLVRNFLDLYQKKPSAKRNAHVFEIATLLKQNQFEFVPIKDLEYCIITIEDTNNTRENRNSIGCAA